MGIDNCKEKAVITINAEEIERVKSFNYQGARIEANGKWTQEVKKRLGIAGSKLGKMANIYKGQSASAKHIILRSIVFPTVTYSSEAWIINNTDGRNITAFEMKCYRKL